MHLVGDRFTCRRAMGLHAGIAKHMRENMPKVYVNSKELRQLSAPQVCVVDFMWLLYRFRGTTGAQLVRYAQAQITSAYDAGCACVVALGDDDLNMPERKRDEQQRRDKRASDANLNAAAPVLDDENAPTDWCAALSNRAFKQVVLHYLHDKLMPPDLKRKTGEVMLVTRMATRGIRAFRAHDGVWSLFKDASMETAIDGCGEADVAAARIVEWLTDKTTYKSFVVRTIDSDSIPILLASQARVRCQHATLHLWLPTCDRAPAGEDVLFGVVANDLHQSAFATSRTGYDSLWSFETRRIVNIDRMLRSFDDLACAWRFCALCVMMGTDFNKKIAHRVGLRGLQTRIARAFKSAHPSRNYQKFFRIVDSDKRLGEGERFRATEWVLGYWGADSLLP